MNNSYCASLTDEYPCSYDNEEDKSFLFLKQFVWLHQYVINEKEEKADNVESNDKHDKPNKSPLTDKFSAERGVMSTK